MEDLRILWVGGTLRVRTPRVFIGGSVIDHKPLRVQTPRVFIGGGVINHKPLQTIGESDGTASNHN